MDTKKFSKTWRSCKNIHSLCKRLNITHQSAYYWARKLGLPTFCETPSETPTAEQIKIRCAEVRANWTPAEEYRRSAGGHARQRYETPSYMTKRTNNAKMPVYVGDMA